MVEAGESEYLEVLKTRNLLIFRDAKNAEQGKLRLTGTCLEPGILSQLSNFVRNSFLR
jgi:hypothetical protein